MDIFLYIAMGSVSFLLLAMTVVSALALWKVFLLLLKQ